MHECLVTLHPKLPYTNVAFVHPVPSLLTHLSIYELVNELVYELVNVRVRK